MAGEVQTRERTVYYHGKWVFESKALRDRVYRAMFPEHAEELIRLEDAMSRAAWDALTA